MVWKSCKTPLDTGSFFSYTVENTTLVNTQADYALIAKDVRKKVLEMIHRGKTSHIGSNFSVIDLAVVLYENLQREDRVVWSKGWSAATTYVLLSRQGHFPKEDLDLFPNTPYIGLTERTVSGIETAGGSMGHGLPVAVGMALAKKRAGEKGNIYCIMSDGEMNEGTTWESALIASHHELDNLVVIIDKNGWQAMGKTTDILSTEPLAEKWMSFNWAALKCDGHTYFEIEYTLKNSGVMKKPCVVICETIKGKGISFMENHLLYHYKDVSDEEYEKAMEELNA